MAQENSISQELADLLVTNNFDPEYRDEGGQSSGPADANIISFDYRSTSGNNYGSAVAVIGDDNELLLFFGDNLGRSMQDQDKDEWFAFLNQMRKLAQTHRYTFSPQNLSRLKHSLAGQAAVKEGLFEGYYGSRRESFIGEPTEARILIKHNKIIGEDDKRYRYIESIFIETADGERFKLQSNRLIHGRAMLEHVRQGGRPYDVRGNHINEMVQELSVLSRFNRAKQHHVYEGITQELVESAAHYYRSLQENLKRLSSSRGYHTYFESWAPDQIDQQESLVEDLKNMFVQQTLDTRIEAALPTLAKIQQQGTKMKEAEIFENYMNRLSEGTWALPDTPEAYEKLQQLMTGELIVGADAMNATEQLYDLVGDDELFDILNDLADNDPRANIWADSDVQRRLAELGIQTPESTRSEPADVDQDTAPEIKEQGVAEGVNLKFPSKSRDTTSPGTVANTDDSSQAMEIADKLTTGKNLERLRGMAYDSTVYRALDRYFVKNNIPETIYNRVASLVFKRINQQGVAEGDNTATFVEADLTRMLRHAGVPVSEGVLTDSTGNTLDHIQDRFGPEVRKFMQSGDMDNDLYDALYDYYFDDMPYGTKKARTGDPYEWVADRFAQDIGLDENLIAPQIMPVSEGSCNMTMEGQYCPEHGLAECGSMYEDGGAVGMPYSMGEGKLNEFAPAGGGGNTPRGPGGRGRDPWGGNDGPDDDSFYKYPKPEHYRRSIDYFSQFEANWFDREDFDEKTGVFKGYWFDQDAPNGLIQIGYFKFDNPAKNGDNDPGMGWYYEPEIDEGVAEGSLNEVTQGVEHSEWVDNVKDAYHPAQVRIIKKRTEDGRHVKSVAMIGDKLIGQYNMNTGVGTFKTAKQQGMAEGSAKDRQWSNKDMERLRRAETELDDIFGTPDDSWTKTKQSQIKKRIQTKPMAGPKGVLPEQDVAEGNDDPINSNSAMTGAYYESKDGDALLARIKSLALIK